MTHIEKLFRNTYEGKRSLMSALVLKRSWHECVSLRAQQGSMPSNSSKKTGGLKVSER